MLGESRIKNLIETTLALSPANDTEVSLSAMEEGVTRFANNAIIQNVAETDADLQVRVIFGRRSGMASTNDFSRESLNRVVKAACEIAQHQPENPDDIRLPDPTPIPKVDSFDERVESASPELRAKAVGDICKIARDAAVIAAGAYSTSAMESAIANSRGLWAYHPSTSVDLTMVATKENGTGYSHGTSWRLDRVQAASLGQEAITRAIKSRAPRHLDPAEYVVILEPYAVVDILENLATFGMGALSFQEGRSWMNGRIGKLTLSPKISIWDDGLDLDGEPQPFDCEGMPKQRVDIVRDGVPSELVYDIHTASHEGRHSTGHAQPYDDDWDGPMPSNLNIGAGDSSVEEMIASTRRGLYITRFWYTNMLSEHNCVLTGMTRDGTFLIERGEIVEPIRNLRFTQSLVKALKNVSAVGREARPIGGYYGSHRVPHLKIDGFRFTGISGQ